MADEIRTRLEDDVQTFRGEVHLVTLQGEIDLTRPKGEVDLTKLEGDPSERANVYFKLKPEKIRLKLKMPGWLGGISFELNSESFPGSNQNTGLTTLCVVGAGCVLAGVAFAIGLPAVAALTVGLVTPIAMFAVIRLMSGRRRR